MKKPIDTKEQKKDTNDPALIPLKQKIEVVTFKMTTTNTNDGLRGSLLSDISSLNQSLHTYSLPTTITNQSYTPSMSQVTMLRQKFSKPIHADGSVVGGKNRTDNFKQLQKRWNKITKS